MEHEYFRLASRACSIVLFALAACTPDGGFPTAPKPIEDVLSSVAFDQEACLEYLPPGGNAQPMLFEVYTRRRDVAATCGTFAMTLGLNQFVEDDPFILSGGPFDCWWDLHDERMLPWQFWSGLGSIGKEECETDRRVIAILVAPTADKEAEWRGENPGAMGVAIVRSEYGFHRLEHVLAERYCPDLVEMLDPAWLDIIKRHAERGETRPPGLAP